VGLVFFGIAALFAALILSWFLNLIAIIDMVVVHHQVRLKAFNIYVVLSVLHELVVDINYVPELHCADWVRDLQCFLNGLLHQDLVEVQNFILSLVRHDQIHQFGSVIHFFLSDEILVSFEHRVGKMYFASCHNLSESFTNIEKVVSFLCNNQHS
jgi:hypothetical protein